jgi:hypothetical protein
MVFEAPTATGPIPFALGVPALGLIVVPLPVDPVEPVLPVEPEEPVLPVDPVEPVLPVDPVDPVLAVEPVEPVVPVDAVLPVDPVIPVGTKLCPGIFAQDDTIAIPAYKSVYRSTILGVNIFFIDIIITILVKVIILYLI